MSQPKSYIIKNISKYDLNLSDLGVRIPLGTSRDLLDPKLKLRWEEIMKSKTSGSIYLRIKKGMASEVANIVPPPQPISRAQVIREAVLVKFPDRVNSSLVIDIGSISDEIRKMSISEDDELLKQLEIESMMEAEQGFLIKDDKD